MLGIQVDGLTDGTNINHELSSGKKVLWNTQEREVLQAKISAREPFLDLIFSRENADGSKQKFQVSGEPMFDGRCRFKGYRGIGIELPAR